MKSKLLVAATVALLSALSVNAQDVITKRDGTEIQATVTEVGNSDVKYARYGTTTPVYTISKADIFMIKYENGTKDTFTDFTASSQKFKSNCFGLDLGIGAISIGDYVGFGSSIGLRWLHNFNSQVGWNAINFKISACNIEDVAAVTVQLMTGIHYKPTSKSYIDGNIGFGSFAISDGINTLTVNGLACEIGAGGYLTRKFFMGGYFNVNTTQGSPVLSYGLRLGWDF